MIQGRYTTNARAALAVAGLLASALLPVLPVWAQQTPSSVAQVEYARGVGFAQAGQQMPRTLGKGLPLQEGDRLTTAEGGTAIVKFHDGTKVTVRPNSEIVVAKYQYKENDSNNNFLIQMVRGGLRAITGLISKGSPNAARLQTSTATVGIRGTDFDARLCVKDCQQETRQIDAVARPNAAQASARLVLVQGHITATNDQGQQRTLVNGGSVYPGDVLETARGAYGVLAFRDESRITLGSATRFKVDQFVFDEKNPREGKFLVSLVRGTLRALTGLIGKTNTQNVRYATPTATVGIRGSGGDISYYPNCEGEPASCVPGLNVYVWLGSFIVDDKGRTALEVLLTGEGLHISGRELRRFTTATDPNIPRPDSVKVPDNLFKHSGSDADEGLFLFVRDGHIEIVSDKEVLHLGKGEAGYVGTDGQAHRPPTIPKFLDFDRIPLPSSTNPAWLQILENAGIKSTKQCN